MSYQLYAREISARAFEWLRAAPRERVSLVADLDLHFEEASYLAAWLEPPEGASYRDAPLSPSAKAQRIARERTAARAEGEARLVLHGLTAQDDVGPVLAHDGWLWAFLGEGIPAIGPLVGHPSPEWAIRGPAPKRGWLGRLFRGRGPLDELEEIGLAAQPGAALSAAVVAARVLTPEEVAQWLDTEPLLAARSAEPADLAVVSRQVLRPLRHLADLAEQVRERGTYYLTWSG